MSSPSQSMRILFAIFFAGQLAGNLAIAQQLNYQEVIRPLLKEFCNDCHTGDDAEAEIDLNHFETVDQIRASTKTWQRVRQMLASQQMPPKDASQPSNAQRNVLSDWVQRLLQSEAIAHAGDPGPVTLRRLSNAEYTFTIRDLTGMDSLNPANEFPVDGAAGEGFTNTGDALVMSPALITKYLDAAKQIAEHAVLMPDGVRFSEHTTRRDWTDESLDRVRSFYGQFVDESGNFLDWEGKNKDAPRSGRIPIRAYIDATLVHRDALQSGSISIDQLAKRTNLNPKYLDRLWNALTDENEHGFVLQKIQSIWRSASQAQQVEIEIERWQQLLWQFNSIGHLGRKGAPKHWMTAKDPLTQRQRLTVQLPTIPTGAEQEIFLSAFKIADEDGGVAWHEPTLQKPGMAPILLRDVQGAKDQLENARNQFRSKLPTYLQAATEVQAGAKRQDVVQAHGINGPTLDRWLAYLGIGGREPVVVQGHLTEKLSEIAGYSFVSGWGSANTPSITANASDQQVRIPGVAAPNSIVVHPSPDLFAAIGWQCPIDGMIQIDAIIADAHPECGNGIEWFLQHRSVNGLVNIDHGDFPTGGKKSVEQVRLEIASGDLVSLIVGPRGGDHSCDLTAVNLKIQEIDGQKRTWNLAEEVSGNILRSNPQPDSHGHDAVWHMYSGRVDQIGKQTREPIPEGSLLARWRQESDQAKRVLLAAQIQRLAGTAPPIDNAPDSVLRDQLEQIVDRDAIDPPVVPADERFGRHPDSIDMPNTDLFSIAPGTMKFRVPAEFASEAIFVVEAECISDSGNPALQVAASLTEPNQASVDPGQPILIRAGQANRQSLTTALDEFRDLFPAALCYTKIVPVDEVVTLQLYYREDHHLKRLMCDDGQATDLDRRWDELLFIAQAPLAAEIALEQIQAFSTQDRPDLTPEFDELRANYRERSDSYRQRLLELEPLHLESSLEFASRAWRRNLTSSETQRLRMIYDQFRQEELSHDEAIRLLLARILIAPAFLYRVEQPGMGSDAVDVTDHELASRLSYFLWSSMPDQSLRALAESRQLNDDQTMVRQSLQMLKDPRVRRMAIHFACQWLHVRDFDKTVEKNERLYPEFNQLRGDLYEEVVLFFDDMFRNDGSMMDLLSADHTFMNQQVAQHYGVDGIAGTQWQRVDGIQERGRGGVLGMATVLASQSGASRTSPILRGNWVYETLLGERLPRPPAGIPQLPEAVPSGKTARELIELHSGAPECAKCHVKIDPYGFALEQFDTVGRLRSSQVDTKTTLPDGRSIEGLDGLRKYLVDQRHDDVIHQFCKKLLGYALGREVQLSDEPLLEQMRKRLTAHDYRFSIAVESIVTSPQFRQIRGRLARSDALE